MNWNTPSLGSIPDFAGDLGITDAGADRAADQKEQKAVAATPKRPRTGSYLDGDYVYFYNAGTDDLYIVLSPKSADRKPVASGSAAYTAIMAAIRNQKAVQISANRVKELRAARGGGRKAPAPKRVAAHAHEEIAEVAPPPPVTPPKTSFLDSLPGWAPYAAGGVILSVIASAVLLSSPRARLATLEK